MLKLFMQIRRWVATGRRPTSRRESGQAIVLIGISMVAIISFAGLAVDVGLLMSSRRELVRVVDATALAAAAALSGSPIDDMETVRKPHARARAREYAYANGFDPDLSGNVLTITFPGDAMTPKKKLVQVEASRPVKLVFMRALGIDNVNISSGARTGEAAPLDVVIVQDLSSSQTSWTYMMDYGDGTSPNSLIDPYWPMPHEVSDVDNYGKQEFTRHSQSVPANPLSGHSWHDYSTVTCSYDPTRPTSVDYTNTVARQAQWNTNKGVAPGVGTASCGNIPWMPFARNQWAASQFVSRLDPNYDKAGLASFSGQGWVNQPLTSSMTTVQNAIGVSPETNGATGRRGMTPRNSGTNLAVGIKVGIQALTDFSVAGGARTNAIGAMIVVTDGSTTNGLDGTSYGNSEQPALLVVPRQDAMTQAINAASSGIVIYTMYVGDDRYKANSTLLLQWIADQTDNRIVDGSALFVGTRNLPTGYGPSLTAAELKTVTKNYYSADPAHPEQIQAAFDDILGKIYTRLTN